MKLRFSKKALARLPEELRFNSDNVTMQKMQLLALIRHPDTRENMKAHYLDVLRVIWRKPLPRHQLTSQRVH